MMKYERLTKQAGWHKDIDLKDELGYSYIYQRLAELENNIEQGTLIFVEQKPYDKFPCEIGDKVFLIYKRYWNVADKKGFWVLRESKVSPHNKERLSNDFGGTVFLTREEAEKRLRELQGERR